MCLSLCRNVSCFFLLEGWGAHPGHPPPLHPSPTFVQILHQCCKEFPKLFVCRVGGHVGRGGVGGQTHAVLLRHVGLQVQPRQQQPDHVFDVLLPQIQHHHLLKSDHFFVHGQRHRRVTLVVPVTHACLQHHERRRRSFPHQHVHQQLFGFHGHVARETVLVPPPIAGVAVLSPVADVGALDTAQPLFRHLFQNHVHLFAYIGVRHIGAGGEKGREDLVQIRQGRVGKKDIGQIVAGDVGDKQHVYFLQTFRQDLVAGGGGVVVAARHAGGHDVKQLGDHGHG